LNVRPATVSKSRTRFAVEGLGGLNDAPRPGAKVVYGKDLDRRILELLDEDPPSGYAI
jgi:hypothetical protein